MENERTNKPVPNKIAPTSDTNRQEDYRDYEERDIEDGWPYADEPGAVSKPAANRAYGETGTNFDGDTNPGYETLTESESQKHEHKLEVYPDGDEAQITDDSALEEAVNDAIENDEALDATGIDIRASNGVVFLQGFVGDARERQRAVEIAGSIAGVKKVKSQLTLNGVDANIPADYDE